MYRSFYEEDDDEKEMKYVKLGNDMIKVIQEFCYLGDVVGSSGDVQSSVMARIHVGWQKLNWKHVFKAQPLWCGPFVVALFVIALFGANFTKIIFSFGFSFQFLNFVYLYYFFLSFFIY